MPEERALAKQDAVLTEGTVAEPSFERAVACDFLVENLVCFGDQAALQRVRPVRAERASEIRAHAIGQGLFTCDSRNAEQAVVVSRQKGRSFGDPGARLVRKAH